MYSFEAILEILIEGVHFTYHTNLMSVQTALLFLLGIIPFPRPNYGAMTLLLVMRNVWYDMDNSMGSAWHNSNSITAKVPVWHILS